MEREGMRRRMERKGKKVNKEIRRREINNQSYLDQLPTYDEVAVETNAQCNHCSLQDPRLQQAPRLQDPRLNINENIIK